MIDHPEKIVERLKAFQSIVRDRVVRSRASRIAGHPVARSSTADTIYGIDADVEPILESFFQDWAAAEVPIVVVAEGLRDRLSNEVSSRTFPDGANPSDARLRILIDPIDGTRGLMYDKRSAWSLAGIAPNKGEATRLRDIEIAVMTELPTAKMACADVLWAIKGQGASGERIDLRSGNSTPLQIRPSQASTIEHGFASVSNFFPGAKVLAAELMEKIAAALLGPADVTQATIFDDQYISTGGQFYELIVGHDRFIADLRPLFYRMQNQPPGLCCHPYDCAAWLIAHEAGVILTDPSGGPLDGPFDTTSGICWVGYANAALRRAIEPIIHEFRGQASKFQS